MTEITNQFIDVLMEMAIKDKDLMETLQQYDLLAQRRQMELKDVIKIATEVHEAKKLGTEAEEE